MAVIVGVAFVACNHDAYNTGDSRYSYLRTDFSRVYTNADARLWSAMTDNGDSLSSHHTHHRGMGHDARLCL